MKQKIETIEERFYHYREPMPQPKDPNTTIVKSIGIPVITVCLLKDDVGHYGRGTCICGKRDNPNKKTGRNIAKGRAIQALLNRQNHSQINNDYAISLFDKHFEDHIGMRFKSEFIPKFSSLTIFEQSLIKQNNE